MGEIGAFAAKTHLAELLARVERGEEFVITRHGRPVARLVPVQRRPDLAERERLIEEIKALRRGQALGGLSWRELRDEGRR
jgi:prevent-host-death family protein